MGLTTCLVVGVCRYRDDEGEVDESEHPYQRLSPVNRRHAPDWYGRQIEKLARDGKVTVW